ncbi:MAG: GAF domain-containing protein [Sulfuritalea sp.]|nr:GAF domain-containing protein [Sulfuritalea sp.]
MGDTLAPPPRKIWRDRISLLVTLIAGTVLTLLAGSGLQQAEMLRTHERQTAATQIVTSTLQSELTRTTEAVRNAGLMIEASPQLTREQFNRHMQNVVENQLSVNLMEWQPIVPARELAKFEAAVRMTGLPDFRVVQPDASGKGWEPVHGRSEYVPVLYFWPERYRTGGLDMSFSPERMASKLQSQSLRRPVASGVFDFIKEGKTQSGTVAIAISTAVFGADGTAKGYLAAIVDLSTLFQSSTRLADSAKFDFLVFASDNPEDKPVYAWFGADSDLKQVSAGLREVTTGDPSATVNVANQTWRLVLHPRPAFYAEVQDYGSLLAFACGTGLTLLMMLYLYQTQISRRNIERADSVLRKEVAERRQAEEQARRIAKLYAVLSECNHAIVHSDSADELFRKVCRAAVTIGGMKMAWIGRVDEATQEIKPVAGHGDGYEHLATERMSADPLSPFSQYPAGIAVREDQPFWCLDCANDPLTVACHDSARAGWAAFASLPLRSGGRTVGAFSVYAGEVNIFDDETRKLLIEIAMDIGFAMDNFANQADRQAAEQRYHSLFDSLIEGFCLIEVKFDEQDHPKDIVYLETNPAFDVQTGMRNVQGKGAREVLPQLEVFWYEVLGKVAVTGEPIRFENEAKELQRWFEVSAYRIGGEESRQVGVLFHDMTARKQAALQLAESEAKRQAEMSSALEAQRHAARAALSLMEDAVAARHQAESLSVTLNEQLDELRRWQQVTLNRESRVLSVKKEINDLLAAHGQPPRYPSALDEGAQE